jgi:hypothetical protein
MEVTPVGFIATLLGGLLLTGVVAWIRRSWLVVLVPRLFPKSQLSDRGQLAEITVFNRGFKTEEDIELRLSPSMTYELVASSAVEATIAREILRIDRIGPSDDATVLLLVEGGTFAKDDITNCVSKLSKGKVVAGQGDVPPTGNQRIGLVVTLLLCAITTGWFITSIYHDATDKPVGAAVSNNRAVDKPVDIDGWVIPLTYARSESSLVEAMKSKNLIASVSQGRRKGELVAVVITIENKTAMLLTFALRIDSNRTTTPNYSRYVSDVKVLPGLSVQKEVQVTIPEHSQNATDANAYVDLYLQSSDGDSLKMDRVYVVK